MSFKKKPLNFENTFNKEIRWLVWLTKYSHVALILDLLHLFHKCFYYVHITKGLNCILVVFAYEKYNRGFIKMVVGGCHLTYAQKEKRWIEKKSNWYTHSGFHPFVLSQAHHGVFPIFISAKKAGRKIVSYLLGLFCRIRG